jgi:hypothetical protein
MKLYIWIGLLIILLGLNIQREGFISMSFANNNKLPSCKSTYSSGSGFVCLDHEQKQQLLTRGGNRTMDADYHMGLLN